MTTEASCHAHPLQPSASAQWPAFLGWQWVAARGHCLNRPWVRCTIWSLLATLSSVGSWTPLPALTLLVSLVGILSERRSRNFGWWMMLWGFAYGAGQLAWMATPDYVGDWCLAAAPLLAWGIGLQWWLWARWLPARLSLSRCIAWGGAWVVFEASREWWLWSGLGFGTVSSLLVDLPFISVAANLLSHYGLSWWLVTLALLIYSRASRLARGAWLLFPALYGLAFSFISTPVHSSHCWLAALQTGEFPLSGFSSGARRFEQLHHLLAQLQPTQHADDLRVVLLPETTLRWDLDTWIGPGETGWRLRDYYQGWADHLQTQLIVGAEWRDEQGSRTGQVRFAPGCRESRYAKRILLPGAEFVPHDSLKGLLATFGIAEGFTPGEGAPLWQTKKIRLQPSVCYESAFAGFVRRGSSPDTVLILSSVNDGWYGTSSLTDHHACSARLRAIETGCPILQSGHTGWTGGWDGMGNPLGTPLPTGAQAGIYLFEGVLKRFWTPWSCWGEMGLVAALALSVVPLLLSLRRAKILKGAAAGEGTIP
jgi:apolipoprotein N-acyltransferase